MRGKFWLKLGIWLFGILVVLYVAFWIALFNPLEGSIDRLDTMVPKTVTWAVTGPWGDIRESELFREHFWGSPTRRELEAALELEEYLYGPIRDLEKQINDSTPGFVGEFSVLEDLMGREVMIAGNLTGPGQPGEIVEKAMNSPYIVLTRISFKARFMEVLKYEAVRKNVPGLKAYRDFYEYDVGEQAIREGAPEEARYFYFQRVKDVLIFTNDRDLVEQAVHLGRLGEISEKSLNQDWFYYYDTQGPKPENAALLWAKVDRIDRELGGDLEEPNQPREGDVADFVRAFFPISQTTSVTLNPGISGSDTIPLTGVVRLSTKLQTHLRGLHRNAGERLGPALTTAAEYLPGDRTFGLVHMKMAPTDFLYAVLTSLDKVTLDLLTSAGEDGRPATRWDAERLSSQLGDWFEEGVTLSWSRLPDVESIDLDTWEGGAPTPMPGLTVKMTLKQSLDPDELIGFFRRNRDEFGFEEPVERPAPLGRLFVVRAPTDKKSQLLKPAFALVGREFLFCSNADELARILQVKSDGGPSLADRGTFRDALASIGETGNLFVFADMANMRPFLLDQRWEYAFEQSSFDQRDFRRRVIIDLTREHPRWTNEQRQAAADRAFDDRMEQARRVDFPDAIRRYRNNMVWYDPFRWISFSLSPGGDETGYIRLDLRGAIRLTSEN